MRTTRLVKKLSTAVQSIEQTCSTNLTAPVQKIEQHNNKQNINNKQRAIYKKDFRRIASWENDNKRPIKFLMYQALDRYAFLKYPVIDYGDTNFGVNKLFLSNQEGVAYEKNLGCS